jgi:hypothetical protein
MFDRAFAASRRAILVFSSIGVLVVVAALGFFVFSAKSEVTPINMDADKVAIHGYDTVAYFTEGKPTKGKNDFEHAWQGARWIFASATHRDMFATNPDRYAPSYGGYCSMGLAIGEYSDADPEAWAIVNGKLYLNKNRRIQTAWKKAPDAYIFAAELNWKKHRKKLRVNESLR